eukprot:TRINITY_DN5856_c0_g1_i1.p1 TRINITY_DN5856_c0_g1~~TRINITY_DN5856_c0_g1_i1.p1  ORF type:complete len:478 (-),score=144.35 TRINITY_DN5856_c0_g1_i1:69-1502(-)
MCEALRCWIIRCSEVVLGVPHEPTRATVNPKAQLIKGTWSRHGAVRTCIMSDRENTISADVDDSCFRKFANKEQDLLSLGGGIFQLVDYKMLLTLSKNTFELQLKIADMEYIGSVDSLPFFPDAKNINDSPLIKSIISKMPSVPPERKLSSLHFPRVPSGSVFAAQSIVPEPSTQLLDSIDGWDEEATQVGDFTNENPPLSTANSNQLVNFPLQSPLTIVPHVSDSLPRTITDKIASSAPFPSVLAQEIAPSLVFNSTATLTMKPSDIPSTPEKVKSSSLSRKSPEPKASNNLHDNDEDDELQFFTQAPEIAQAGFVSEDVIPQSQVSRPERVARLNEGPVHLTPDLSPMDESGNETAGKKRKSSEAELKEQKKTNKTQRSGLVDSAMLIALTSSLNPVSSPPNHSKSSTLKSSSSSLSRADLTSLVQALDTPRDPIVVDPEAWITQFQKTKSNVSNEKEAPLQSKKIRKIPKKSKQ